MANAIVTQRDTQLERQRAGYIQLSLTNFTNNDEPTIAAGSVVEISGTLYSVTTNESITGWAGVSNGPVWIKLAPDGTDPFTAEYTDVAPTWIDSKQAWYDGTGTDRYVAGLTKTGASGYEDKFNMAAVEMGMSVNQGFFGFSRIDLLSTVGADTWVVPNGVYRIKVTVIGGGGGGGGSGTNSRGGTGGGGGGTSIQIITTTPGTSYPYNVGAGGSGATAGNNGGGNGSASAFNTTIIGGGGGGGQAANAATLQGGLPGIPSGGLLESRGEYGGGVYSENHSGDGGSSGFSYGNGGQGQVYLTIAEGSGGAPFEGGRLYGGGGSGGYRFTANAAGASGAQGAVIIEY